MDEARYWASQHPKAVSSAKKVVELSDGQSPTEDTDAAMTREDDIARMEFEIAKSGHAAR